MSILRLMARFAPWFLAAGVTCGIAVPGLAAVAKPLIGPAVFVILTAALAQLDLTHLRREAQRPSAAAVAVLWVLIATPMLMSLIVSVSPLPPTIAVSLLAFTLAPSIIGAPAFAALFGMRLALALVVSVGTNMLTPLILPALSVTLLGRELGVDAWTLMCRLMLLVGCATVAAAALRALLGSERLRAYGPNIDGALILGLIVLAIGVMDGVGAQLTQAPERILLLMLCAFVANFGAQAVTLALFLPFGRNFALTVAMLTGNRNGAILIAAMGVDGDALVKLFLALGLLPMYLSPLLLGPTYRRLLGDTSERSPPPVPLAPPELGPGETWRRQGCRHPLRRLAASFVDEEQREPTALADPATPPVDGAAAAGGRRPTPASSGGAD